MSVGSKDGRRLGIVVRPTIRSDPLPHGRGGIEISKVMAHQRELIQDITGGLPTLQPAKQTVCGDAERSHDQ